VDPDGPAWTFTLLTNAVPQRRKDSPGRHIKYTFDRILNPKTAAPCAGLYAQIDSIGATDPAAVVLPPEGPSRIRS
jgi:ABC-type oligopeptide transport system substrate-binding subunit